MKAIEFHFNPKTKEGLIFDSFCFEPENTYERKLGSLYMAGILKNTLPKNNRFLDNLTRVMRETYYRLNVKNPEMALKESLKGANRFLEEIAKRGDVSWLGNISFVILSLKKHDLNFTKVGDLRIFLLRGGHLIDIDKKLNLQEIEPYPLKIFGNIVAGELAEDDILLVLSKDICDFFKVHGIFDEITKIVPFDEKKLGKIFEKKRKELLGSSGLCLLLNLSQEKSVGRREEISSQDEKEFSFTKAFRPITSRLSPIVKLLRRASKATAKRNGEKISKKVSTYQDENFLSSILKKIPGKMQLPKFSLPKPLKSFPGGTIKSPIQNIGFNMKKLRKNALLLAALVFFLAVGFFISQNEEKRQIQAYQSSLEQIEKKVEQAEGIITLENNDSKLKEKANTLFKESWQDISPLLNVANKWPAAYKNRLFELRDKISENLYRINNVTIVDNPELFFEFNTDEFIPQKFSVFNNSLYFFSPYVKNVFAVDTATKGKIMHDTDEGNYAAASFDNSLIFFSKPDKLTIFNGNERLSSALKDPRLSLENGDDKQFNLNGFSLFNKNIYFLNKDSGKIIKYPYIKNFEWSTPQLWLAKENENAAAKSMAVDGSVWVLNDDDSITRYHSGYSQDVLRLNIYPEPKNLSKILISPSSPYIYLLEPIQKRIIIISKDGKIIAQYQSDAFNNLLDFSVSADGKTLYLLNGQKVFRLIFSP